MGLKKNQKIMKPVLNNRNANSPLQFEVNKDIKKSKKINSKMVFDTPGGTNVKKNNNKKVNQT